MKTRQGFTLVELLVTVTLLTIIALFSYPNMQNLVRTSRARAEKNHWVSLLNFARGTAITENTRVVLCPIIDDECVNDVHQPWVIFTDPNKSRTIDTTEKVLREFTPRPESMFGYYSSGVPYFRFGSDTSDIYQGMPEGFTICTLGLLDNTAYHLTVNIIGRVKVFNERNSEGQPLRYHDSHWELTDCSR